MALAQILFVLGLNIYAGVCENTPKNTGDNPIIQQQNENFFLEFSKETKIREESESILSKLITAKSPFIYNWIKKENLNPINDSEEIARRWFFYYSKNLVIATYPKNEQVINELVEKYFDKAIKDRFPPQKKSELNELLRIEKLNAINTIVQYPFSKEQKSALVERINAISFYWPTQLRGSKFENFPLEFFDWSFAYDPKTNEINIGFNAPIENLNLTRVILLHEIAHSFDSCRWNQFSKLEWPFLKVGQCLREFAAPRDDSKIKKMLEDKKISKSEYEFFIENPTCNNSKYPPEPLQADQLPESFADWFSALAVNEQIIDNDFRRDLCIDKVQKSGSSYLKNRDRLFKIYLSNKKIQEKLKHSSNYLECKPF